MMERLETEFIESLDQDVRERLWSKTSERIWSCVGGGGSIENAHHSERTHALAEWLGFYANRNIQTAFQTIGNAKKASFRARTRSIKCYQAREKMSPLEKIEQDEDIMTGMSRIISMSSADYNRTDYVRRHDDLRS